MLSMGGEIDLFRPPFLQDLHVYDVLFVLIPTSSTMVERLGRAVCANSNFLLPNLREGPGGGSLTHPLSIRQFIPAIQIINHGA